MAEGVWFWGFFLCLFGFGFSTVSLRCVKKTLSDFFSSVLLLFSGLAVWFGTILDLLLFLTNSSFLFSLNICFTEVHLFINCFCRGTTLTLAGWCKNTSQSPKQFKSRFIFWAINGSPGTDTYNPAVRGHLLRSALWRKSRINSVFFSSTKGFFCFLFDRWTMLHSLMSMWWELHCLQEWNQGRIFGLLWHMFTCNWDPSMIVSIKHMKSYKPVKRLDKQGTASAKGMYVKEKGTGISSIRLKTLANIALQIWGLFLLLQLKS